MSEGRAPRRARIRLVRREPGARRLHDRAGDRRIERREPHVGLGRDRMLLELAVRVREPLENGGGVSFETERDVVGRHGLLAISASPVQVPEEAVGFGRRRGGPGRALEELEALLVVARAQVCPAQRETRLSALRVHPHRSLECGDGLLERDGIPGSGRFVEPELPELLVGGRGVGVALERPPDRLDRTGVPPCGAVYRREAQIRSRRVGIAFDLAVDQLAGLVRPPVLEVELEERLTDDDVLRTKGQRAPIVARGLLDGPERAVDRASKIVGLPELGLRGHRASEGVDRFGLPAPAKSSESEAIHHGHVFGVPGEHLLVPGRRVVEPPELGLDVGEAKPDLRRVRRSLQGALEVLQGRSEVPLAVLRFRALQIGRRLLGIERDGGPVGPGGLEGEALDQELVAELDSLEVAILVAKGLIDDHRCRAEHRGCQEHRDPGPHDPSRLVSDMGNSISLRNLADSRALSQNEGTELRREVSKVS